VTSLLNVGTFGVRIVDYLACVAHLKPIIDQMAAFLKKPNYGHRLIRVHLSNFWSDGDTFRNLALKESMERINRLKFLLFFLFLLSAFKRPIARFG
jgi:hypothetical protein